MTYQYWKTNELQHSGVKGMKWGVRKVKQKLKAYDKYRKAYSERKKFVKNRNMMSDSDIDKYIIRLRKENELAKLYNQNISATRPLKRFGSSIGTMLGDSGKKIVSGALVSTGTAALVYAAFKTGKNSKNKYARNIYEAISFGKQFGVGFGKKK